jgi:hypothetical protein
MRPPSIEECLRVTKSAASLATVLALGVFSPPSAAVAEPYVYQDRPVAWIVAQGYSGFSGYPWPGPPFASPIAAPAYGCYVSRTRLRLKGAWRDVEVCF